MRRFPLSARALAILQEMPAFRTADDADAQVSFLLRAYEPTL
jgi:hypothetical protein